MGEKGYYSGMAVPTCYNSNVVRFKVFYYNKRKIISLLKK